MEHTSHGTITVYISIFSFFFTVVVRQNFCDSCQFSCSCSLLSIFLISFGYFSKPAFAQVSHNDILDFFYFNRIGVFLCFRSYFLNRICNDLFFFFAHFAKLKKAFNHCIANFTFVETHKFTVSFFYLQFHFLPPFLYPVNRGTSIKTFLPNKPTVRHST